MSEQGPSAPAGWYAHPSMSNTQCYWDGGGWTEHISPGLPQGGTHVAPGDAAYQAGQTLTLVGLVLAVVLPLAGVVVAFMLLAKREVKAGVVVLAVSVASGYFWFDRLQGG